VPAIRIASEIRKLADKTHSATRQISEQISAMQIVTLESVDAMSSIKEQALELSAVTSEMAKAGEEHSRAAALIADRAVRQRPTRRLFHVPLRK